MDMNITDNPVVNADYIPAMIDKLRIDMEETLTDYATLLNGLKGVDERIGVKMKLQSMDEFLEGLQTWLDELEG